MTDTRAFDGPFDKRRIREENRWGSQLLRDGLYVRVPHGTEDTTYGEMVEVENGPNDHGRRWTHVFKPGQGMVEIKNPLPISFDAGSKALYASPLGWRVLLGYHKDDPTYGFDVTVFDPSGRIKEQATQLDGLTSWLDANAP